MLQGHLYSFDSKRTSRQILAMRRQRWKLDAQRVIGPREYESVATFDRTWAMGFSRFPVRSPYPPSPISCPVSREPTAGPYIEAPPDQRDAASSDSRSSGEKEQLCR